MHQRVRFTGGMWASTRAMVIWCVALRLGPLSARRGTRPRVNCCPQNATSLKVLAATGGAWTPEKYATALQLDFGPGSEYDQFGQLEGGIAQELWPVPGPWLQAGMRTFLRKLREGKSVEEAADETDDQGDAFSRVPALAAARAFGAVASGADLAAAKAALTSEVQAFVGTYQAAPISKASGLTAARIIFDVVAGTCGVRDAVLGAIDALAADDPADVPHASQLHAALVEVVHKWAMDEKRAYTAITGEAGNHCREFRGYASCRARTHACALLPSPQTCRPPWQRLWQALCSLRMKARRALTCSSLLCAWCSLAVAAVARAATLSAPLWAERAGWKQCRRLGSRAQRTPKCTCARPTRCWMPLSRDRARQGAGEVSFVGVQCTNPRNLSRPKSRGADQRSAHSEADKLGALLGG